MSSTSEDIYVLLGLEVSASAAEIRKAYRQKSLKVHPDRNPDNPEAANLFHALTEAADLLLDPGKRADYDKKYAAEKARKERFAALDNKRKAGLADLEERENQYKRQELDRERSVNQARQVESLKEEAVRLRMQRQQQAQEQQTKSQQEAKSQAQQQQSAKPSGVLDLGPLDTTLLLNFPKVVFTDADDLRDRISASAPLSAIDNLIYSDKKSKKSHIAKQAKAVVAFNTLAATIALYKALTKEDFVKQGVEVKWASREPPAPARKALGLDKPQAQVEKPTAPSQTQQKAAPAPSEADILRRMAERQRLEEEIRKSEAQET